MKDDVRKTSSEKNASGVSETAAVHPPAGELTCSEGQVEDLLADGESTESDEEDDLDESQNPSPSKAATQTSSPIAKSNRKEGQ